MALDSRRKRHAQDVSSIPLDKSAEVISRLRAADMPADEIAARGEMTALLERLIESLQEELRNPLALSLAEELSSAEIAALLEIPEGTVRQRMWKARQMLKEKLSVLLEGQHGR